ncbi:YbdK family carboxylate-amine ligase [uncultured Agrococcus sp.]|uniref:carboxylate-amine ligase n=1 Tax=uncultured Agrococcus sp. TaxID=382258 RepID=UPI0025F938EE|nr:YbdK family carboxylate-amine ligase [uncultured Agrococcus sp.]
MSREGYRRFGVEEEYLLLKDADGRPADRAADVIHGMRERREQADQEYFLSQLEAATPICRTAGEAAESLERFRGEAASAARERGLVLAGSGMPPAGGETEGTRTPGRRYRRIADALGATAKHQFATGTHVHVEIPSRDAGVRVLRRLARWAPALLAMTANSPVWCEERSGFMTWRYVSYLTWPISGWPPDFTDGSEYDGTIAQLVRAGILLDSGVGTWAARLSDDYPTLELRIADAQLRASDAVVFGALVRALVERCIRDDERGAPPPSAAPALVNASLWLAARDGLEGELMDPSEGDLLPGIDLLERAVETAADELERFGDLALVERRVEALRRDGSPAAQQSGVFEREGIRGLLALYRETWSPARSMI